MRERKLVSACHECKGERPANDFLLLLYREGRVTGAELIRGLQSLKLLAAGKLRIRDRGGLYGDLRPQLWAPAMGKLTGG